MRRSVFTGFVWFLLLLLGAIAASAQSHGVIAFTSNRDGNSEIYVANADGSGLRNLTNHPERDNRPTWSPDGTRLLFLSRRDTPDHSQIFVMNADGTDVRRLTSEDNFSFFNPAWSPDGTRIVYEREENDDSVLYMMNADGTNPTLLISPDQIHDASNPAWSPDGTHIAFQAQSIRSTDLYLLNLSNQQMTQLTDAERSDTRPIWSPDGARIAFSSTREGAESKAFIMNPDGSDQRRLTNSPPELQEIVTSWSPDGRSLILAIEENDLSSLHFLDLATSTLTPFQVSDQYDDSQGIWRPEPGTVAAIPLIPAVTLAPTATPENLLILGGDWRTGIASFDPPSRFPLDVPQGSFISVDLRSTSYFSTYITTQQGSFLLPFASIRSADLLREFYLVGVPGPYTLQLTGEGDFEISVVSAETVSPINSLQPGVSATGIGDASQVQIFRLEQVNPGDSLAVETNQNFVINLVNADGVLLPSISSNFDLERSQMVTRFLLEGPAPYTLALQPQGEYAVALNLTSAAIANETVVTPGQTVDGAPVGAALSTYTLEGVSQGDLVTIRLDGQQIWTEGIELFTLLSAADNMPILLGPGGITASLEHPNHLVAVYDLAAPGPYRITLPGLNIPYTMTVTSGDTLQQFSPPLLPGQTTQTDARDGAVIPVYPLTFPAGADQITVQLDDPSRLMSDSIPALRTAQMILRDSSGHLYQPNLMENGDTRWTGLFELQGTRPPYEVIIIGVEGAFNIKIDEGNTFTQATLTPGQSVLNTVPPPSARHTYLITLEEPAVFGTLLQPGSRAGNTLSITNIRSYPELSSLASTAGSAAVNGRALNFYSLNAGSYLLEIVNNPRGASDDTYTLSLIEKSAFEQGDLTPTSLINLTTPPSLPASEPLPILAVGQTVNGSLGDSRKILGANTRDAYQLDALVENTAITLFTPAESPTLNLYALSADRQLTLWDNIRLIEGGSLYTLPLSGQPPYQLIVDGTTQYTLRLEGTVSPTVDAPILLRPGDAQRFPTAQETQSAQRQLIIDAPPQTSVRLEVITSGVTQLDTLTVTNAAGDVLETRSASTSNMAEITLTGEGPYTVTYAHSPEHIFRVVSLS